MAVTQEKANPAAEPLVDSKRPSKGIMAGLRTWSKSFQGWRGGATLCATTAAMILCINAILIIAGAAKSGNQSGLTTIQEGSCSETNRLDVWLHLLINILSSALLAASNYCMQCLSAPTRGDIDKAHKQKRWLDIGIHSIRNLRHISTSRLCLWWLLGLSSVPLHLLYNSAIIASKAAQDYDVFVASPALINRTQLDGSKSAGQFKFLGYTETNNDHEEPPTLDFFRDVSSWNRLSNADCIKAYSQTYVTGRGDVIAITSESTTLNATVPVLLAFAFEWQGTSTYGVDWICSGTALRFGCDKQSLQDNPSAWTLQDLGDDHNYTADTDTTYSVFYPVEYCLSQPVEDHCSVQLSLVIMGVVIACNAVKLLCIVLMLRKQREAPLVTVGDAVVSFMSYKDSSTAGMCWADKKTFIKNRWGPAAKPFRRQRHFWFASASVTRWLICNVCSIATISIAGFLFYLGIGELKASDTRWQTSGFGAFNTKMKANWTFNGVSGSLLLALIANAPQLLLSLLFLAYNSLYTCMLLADEWSGYSKDRKTLRVTQPHGAQRSTYFLQLPYRYSIVLLITSTLLHWFVSQSLFLARVNVFYASGELDSSASIATIGYSVVPLLVVLILGSVTVAMGLLNGCRRYRPGIPLAGSCSAAISAACHAPDEDVDAVEKPLLWGAGFGKEKDGAVGHCSFTSLEAEMPVEGKDYSGLVTTI